MSEMYPVKLGLITAGAAVIGLLAASSYGATGSSDPWLGIGLKLGLYALSSSRYSQRRAASLKYAG